MHARQESDTTFLPNAALGGYDFPRSLLSWVGGIPQHIYYISARGAMGGFLVCVKANMHGFTPPRTITATWPSGNRARLLPFSCQGPLPVYSSCSFPAKHPEQRHRNMIYDYTNYDAQKTYDTLVVDLDFTLPTWPYSVYPMQVTFSTEELRRYWRVQV